MPAETDTEIAGLADMLRFAAMRLERRPGRAEQAAECRRLAGRVEAGERSSPEKVALEGLADAAERMADHASFLAERRL